MARGPQAHNLPIVGDLMANPQEEEKLRGMKEAGKVYGGARQGAAQSRMNALSNQMAAFQPANNALATMYGSQNSLDPSMMLRSPFTGQGPPPAPGDGLDMASFRETPEQRDLRMTSAAQAHEGAPGSQMAAIARHQGARREAGAAASGLEAGRQQEGSMGAIERMRQRRAAMRGRTDELLGPMASMGIRRF